MSKKWNIFIVAEKFLEKDYLVMEDIYYNTNTKMKVQHLVCGNIFSINFHNFLKNRGCPKCSRKIAREKRLETMIRNNGYFVDLNNEWSPRNILPPTKYTPKSNTKVWWICKIHGEYSMKVSDKTNGSDCNQCSSEKRKEKKKNTILLRNGNLIETNPEIIDDWSNKNEILPKDCTFGSAKKIWWICKKNHPDYLMSINKRAQRGMGCPKCAVSVGEKEISSILSKIGFEFIEEYRFKDCKYRNTLPFDFYIPSLNLCIEYQGEQHYRVVRFGGLSEEKSVENLKEQKKRDVIKKRYCEKNDISLLIIKYTKKDILEKIILKKISDLK